MLFYPKRRKLQFLRNVKKKNSPSWYVRIVTTPRRQLHILEVMRMNTKVMINLLHQNMVNVNFESDEEGEMEKHIRSIHETTCIEYDYFARNKQELRKHVESKHIKKCEICDETFAGLKN